MPGDKLADLVTKHMCKVFTEHRKALKNNLGYSIRRAGDPPANLMSYRRVTACVWLLCYSESIGATGPILKDGD